MFYEVPTKASPAQAGKALEYAAQRRKFGLLMVHNLRETMTKKGVEPSKECLIYEVCNPVQAKRILENNMSIATAPPCWIAIL